MIVAVKGEYSVQMTLENINYCYYVIKFPGEIIYKAKGYDDAINKLKELTKES